MKDRVLVDTGPLVAIFSRADTHHAACLAELRRLSSRFLPAGQWSPKRRGFLGELLGVQRLLNSFNHGFLKLLELEDGAMPWLSEFLFRYRDLPAQLADAALVYLAELHGIEAVFTLDRQDFSVYRLSDKSSLRIVPETLA